MTLLPPRLVVSCPGRSLAAVRSEVARAAQEGADLAEVRVDRLPPVDQARLDQLFPSPLPLIATLRSRAEGGEGPSDPRERAGPLDAASRLPFRFVDLERARDAERLTDPRWGSPGGPSVVLSSHLPRAPSVLEVRTLLELPRPAGAVAKVVFPCDFGRLWADLLPGLTPTDAIAPYVLHTTGASGPLLRAWAYRLGMFAVYAALPSAPGSSDPAPVEASQLPLDRVRPFFAAGPNRPLFAVVGHPVEHSLSPALHSYWMQREGRCGLYLALDMPTSRDLGESLGPLAAGGFLGLNVTHPWKEVALQFASHVAPAAEAAGCANTLSFADGEVRADNTDVVAVRRRLLELRDRGSWDGSPVVVLGAGGAARSALAALSSMGASGVVFARRPEAADRLAREFGATAGRKGPLRAARLVVHATTVGREGQAELDLPWEDTVDRTTHVLDFVYAPTHPFLRHRAAAAGASYEDGSRLLVYQAAESYAGWWGSPPSAALQEAALQEVACMG